MKTTQFEKVHIICKVNELNITQFELFSFFFYFMCVATDVSKLFCLAHLANIERFLSIVTFHLKYEIVHTPRQKSIRALEIFRVQKLILNATS